MKLLVFPSRQYEIFYAPKYGVGASSRIDYLHATSLTDVARLRCLVSNFTMLAEVARLSELLN